MTRKNKITKRRIIFLYWLPSHFHASFAKKINAEFRNASQPINLRTKKNIISQMFCSFLNAFFLPKQNIIYFCEGTFYMPAILKKFGLLKNCKIINIQADAVPAYFFLNNSFAFKFKKIIFKFLLKEVDGFICVSKMENDLIKKLLPDTLSHVVYPYIPKNRFKPLQNIHPNLESHNLLFIANGHDPFYKGIDLLLDSFKIVKEKFSDATLTIVGDWKIENWMKQPGVQFVGTQKNIDKYIKNSGLYVHLGRGEAFGVSVAEAALGGLPVIVSEWTGAKSIIEECAPQNIVELDPKKVSEKIEKYFNMGMYKKKRLSLIERKSAKKYSYKNSMSELDFAWLEIQKRLK